MKRLFQNISIRNYIMIMLFILTLIPAFCVSFFSYNYSLHFIKNDYTDRYYNAIASDFEDNIDNMTDQINNIFLSILTYEPLRTVLIDATNNQYSYEFILDSLNKIIPDDYFVKAVSITGKNGTVYTYAKNDNIIKESMNDDYLSELDSNFTIYSKCLSDISGNHYICFGKKIIDYTTGVTMGPVIFYVEEKSIRSIYDSNETDESLVFITVDDNIISHSNDTYINSIFYMPEQLINSSNEFFTHSNYLYKLYNTRIKKMNNCMTLNIISSYNNVYALFNRINQYSIYILVISTMMAIILSYVLSKKLTNNIVELKDNINRFSKDSSDYTFVEPKNEIRALELHYNKMVKSIQNLIKMNNIAIENKRIAEIRALQSQINPHFVYNTVNSIYWMAKLKKPYDQIENLTLAAATFFRTSFYKSGTATKIYEEIQHVKSYLEIEAIRFPELFDVEFCIDENILEADTVRIILQPIVENSIKHGFKDIDYKGKLNITGYLDANDDICFVVSDNGCGFSCEDNSKIPNSNKKSSGYGLYNVDERLKIEYGKEYGLTINSAPSCGTTVILKIKGPKNQTTKNI